MIFDRTLLFSNAQALTASAASTDIVDLLATGRVYGAAANLTKDIGKGQGIPLLVQVVSAAVGLASVTIAIQVDDNEAFSSPKEVASQTIPLASLTAGAQFNIQAIPPGTNERYLRINYTLTDDGTVGGMAVSFTAGVVMGVQSNT